MTTKDKLRITRLLGIGVKDIKKLNVGYMGYANGWYPPFGKSWMDGGLERHILELCNEQGVTFQRKRGTWDCDSHYYNEEYNISYNVDSSG